MIRSIFIVATVAKILDPGAQLSGNSPVNQVHAFSTFGSHSLLYRYNLLGFESCAHKSRRRGFLSMGAAKNNRRGILEIIDDEVSDLKKLGRSIQEYYKPINVRKEQKGNNEQATEGLSKSHRSMFATTTRRQRCVTGAGPLTLTVVENPTRKWLSSGTSRSSKSIATSQLLVNGTSLDRSLASYDRFQWLDDEERATLNAESAYALLSLEFLAEIHVRNPGYVNILPANAAGYSAKIKRDQGTWQNAWKQNDVLSNLLGEETDDEEEKERMWITGFSLTNNRGQLRYVDVKSGYMGNVHGTSGIRWPNEVNAVPDQPYNSYEDNKNKDKPSVVKSGNKLQDSLLVSDGFLVPGRDNGGLHVIINPGDDKKERRFCITGTYEAADSVKSKSAYSKKTEDILQSTDESGWFYHRSIWIDLTGDGRQSILTARAKRPSFLNNINGKTDPLNQEASSPMLDRAQLVWLECPVPHSYHELTGMPLDVDGAEFDPFHPRYLPWKLRVLDDGPDVMFSVADLDTSDDTIEVIASQFFSKKLTLHSIRRGPEPKVVFRRTLDGLCGSSYSSIFANLDVEKDMNPSRIVIDSGSTVPTLKSGDPFSHLLITSHECSYANKGGVDSTATPQNSKRQDDQKSNTKNNRQIEENIRVNTFNDAIDGGSLFSYRVPTGKDAWKTETWTRSVVATGFHVSGQLGNMINPGAPGFCYTFYPKKDDTSLRPLIAIAGDCAESAYILRPVENVSGQDPSASYTMMCKIECGATVGSIGIGYEDFCFMPQQKGYAKIYISCYEIDKVLVFSMGNGEDSDSNK